eukprot:TRINITY_DN13735_c0_g2_i1.p1 TRINITY_DN13735_c0_g2~~TRINITY_DN13735_c0_g2_i1.p1  ORF type:complete len:273 (+),score=69.46 TRINITY_DN13735_c0_g2_i1:47-865(+)
MRLQTPQRATHRQVCTPRTHLMKPRSFVLRDTGGECVVEVSEGQSVVLSVSEGLGLCKGEEVMLLHKGVVCVAGEELPSGTYDVVRVPREGARGVVGGALGAAVGAGVGYLMGWIVEAVLAGFGSAAGVIAARTKPPTAQQDPPSNPKPSRRSPEYTRIDYTDCDEDASTSIALADLHVAMSSISDLPLQAITSDCTHFCHRKGIQTTALTKRNTVRMASYVAGKQCKDAPLTTISNHVKLATHHIDTIMLVEFEEAVQVTLRVIAGVNRAG